MLNRDLYLQIITLNYCRPIYVCTLMEVTVLAKYFTNIIYNNFKRNTRLIFIT